MVKVISTAPHHSVVKEVVCRNCGSTLEYVPKDIKQGIHYDYTGGADYVRYIECPTCTHNVGVN
jgi:DNA-directed RNA polymerase subunit RPC12/RpoP